jgi:hypothetical protein
MINHFTLTRIFNIQIKVTLNNVINGDFPRLIIFNPCGKTILFITPPIKLSLKLFKLHGFCFVVIFYALLIRVLIKPDIFSECAFGKKIFFYQYKD